MILSPGCTVRSEAQFALFVTVTEASSELQAVIQSAESLNNALRLTESDLRRQLINYNENPVDVWCWGNAALQLDKYGRALCVKQQAKAKIDGAVCTIILNEMYRRNRTEFAQIVARERS